MEDDLKKALNKYFTKNECIELIYKKIESDKYSNPFNPKKNFYEMIMNEASNKVKLILQKRDDLSERLKDDFKLETIETLNELDAEIENLFVFEEKLRDWIYKETSDE